MRCVLFLTLYIQYSNTVVGSPSPSLGRGVALASADWRLVGRSAQAARANMHEIECVERLALNSLMRELLC